MEKEEFEKEFKNALGYGKVIVFKNFMDSNSVIHAISYTFEDVENNKVGLIVESGKQYDVSLNEIERIW